MRAARDDLRLVSVGIGTPAVEHLRGMVALDDRHEQMLHELTDHWMRMRNAVPQRIALAGSYVVPFAWSLEVWHCGKLCESIAWPVGISCGIWTHVIACVWCQRHAPVMFEISQVESWRKLMKGKGWEAWTAQTEGITADGGTLRGLPKRTPTVRPRRR